jgi:hypothetical protein
MELHCRLRTPFPAGTKMSVSMADDDVENHQRDWRASTCPRDNISQCDRNDMPLARECSQHALSVHRVFIHGKRWMWLSAGFTWRSESSSIENGYEGCEMTRCNNWPILLTMDMFEFIYRSMHFTALCYQAGSFLLRRCSYLNISLTISLPPTSSQWQC